MKFKLVEETNNLSPQEMLKNIINKFHSMTEDNIISEVGGVVSTISAKSPMFIAPSGRFVDVGKATLSATFAIATSLAMIMVILLCKDRSLILKAATELCK